MNQKKRFNKMYQLLYKHFGPQNWWPAQTSFEVIVGAVLTQNAAWANVEKAIINLRRSKKLSFRKLLEIGTKDLAVLIRPSGYFNIKAKRLKNLLNFIDAYYRGSIKAMKRVPLAELRGQLLSVNGIGKETADSILLYALDKPIFVVDAYTKRILLRHDFIQSRPRITPRNNFSAGCQVSRGAIRKPGIPLGKLFVSAHRGFAPGEEDLYDNIQSLAMSYLKKSVSLFNEYHALLVRLAKEYCKKTNPLCKECPLANL